MKKIFTLVAVAMFFGALNANAQCTGDRYKMQVFWESEVTSDIQYGSNINEQGNNENLALDVYEPTGDSLTNRPLLILAHGGSFVGGSKTGSDVVPLAQDFAKMGYVVASINYRLGFEGLTAGILDSVTATETVVRSVHDYRAAIRFFKKDFSENGNTYGIDTSLIFGGGVSAGAITAVHVAYLDELSELPTYIDTTKAGLGGGIEGNSGNQNYVSTGLAGIINIAGALRDTSWITSTSLPIISFHGNQDGTVPYGSDIIYLQAVFPIMMVDGSQTIHIRADNAGVTNCLHTHEGADHIPHSQGNQTTEYTDTTLTISSNFMSSVICNETFNCLYGGTTVYVGIHENASQDATVYPVPSQSIVNIQAGSIIQEIKLINMLGEIVMTKQGTNSDNLQITKNNLPNGVYILSIKTHQGIITKKISFE